MRSSSLSSQSRPSDYSFPILLPFLLVLAVLFYFWHTSDFANPELLFILGSLFFFLCFFFAKTGLVLLVISMLFSPEITLGFLSFRAVDIRLEDLMIPVLLFAWLGRLTIKREYRIITRSPLNVPILILLGWTLFSTAYALVNGGTQLLPALFYTLKSIQFFCIFFLVLNYVRAVPTIRQFLFFVLLTLALVGIYTLVQVPSVEIFTEKRITAPFEGSTPEPGTVGGYMAFLLLMILAMFLYEENAIRRWGFGFLGAVVLIPFIYTLNRTSYVALLGGLACLVFLERKRKSLVFLFLAFLLTSPLWVPRAVKDRIAFTWEDAQNPGRTMGVDSSFQGRIVVYEKVWNCLKNPPQTFLGCGVGSTDMPDSQYARTLYEIGFVGVGLWAWIFVRLFRISRWLFETVTEGTWRGMVQGYRVGLVAILLHGFGAITFYTVRIMEPFWFITGLVVSLYLIKISETTPVEAVSRGEIP